jgi:Cu(I)/Ag(I) efflux system membrane fusion protein
MKNVVGIIGGAVVGSIVTLAGIGFLGQESDPSETGVADQPLYWVAPMDPGYRRDAPGKSPMGMELVPVYSEAKSDAGVIRINPDVAHNLGVRTDEVTRATWAGEIRTVGYINYDEDQLVHIHPRVQGWVETLYVKAAGNPVTKNQPLYALYSPELVNAQEEMLLAVKRKNRQLVDGARRRLRALQMSDSFIDNLISTGEVAQTVTFRAPQSGVVDNLAIREGFYVQPGTTMMSIGILDDVWVEVEVFARQSAQIKAGLKVSMTLDYLPGRRWEGQVDYLYPTLDPKLRTARARLRFANLDGVLKPNMFAQVVIHVDSENNVLSVPREAVIRMGSNNHVVLALGDGYYKSVAVTLGRVGEQRAEILDGLEQGDRVVTSAQFLIDSESSRSSDFKRMSHSAMGQSTQQQGLEGVKR